MPLHLIYVFIIHLMYFCTIKHNDHSRVTITCMADHQSFRVKIKLPRKLYQRLFHGRIIACIYMIHNRLYMYYTIWSSNWTPVVLINPVSFNVYGSRFFNCFQIPVPKSRTRNVEARIWYVTRVKLHNISNGWIFLVCDTLPFQYMDYYTESYRTYW